LYTSTYLLYTQVPILFFFLSTSRPRREPPPFPTRRSSDPRPAPRRRAPCGHTHMTDPIEQPTPVPPEHRRTIKSFVMRAGRMTTGQQRGLELGWPKFGLELEDGMLDLDKVFGRQAPRTFEIGFGMGQATLEMAAAAPDQDFIGVEVHKPGVGALLNGLLQQNLGNVRVYSCDALEVLRNCIPDASLDRVLLFFPDPWHKARHHKRRIVQPAF